MEVDLTLDQIIKSTKKTAQFKRNWTGRGRPNNMRRGFKRVQTRRLPERWKRDLHRTISDQNGFNRIIVSNLSFMVTDEDIRELFSEFGPLKKAFVNYDKSGRSHGTAEIVFMESVDAGSAIKKYNGVSLDGRPMKIEPVTSKNDSRGLSTRVQFSNGRTFGSRRGRFSNGRLGRRPLIGNRKRGNKKSLPLSKDQLDAELDKYKKGDIDMTV